MIVVEVILRFFLRLLSWLPLKVHYLLAALLAWLAEKVFRYRVHDVTVNLARSFPGKKYAELKDIRHRFYRHFADVIAETVWFGGLRGPGRLHSKRLVELVNPGTLTRLYDSAPSVMVLLSHSGNWELVGGTASYVYNDDPLCFNEQNFCVVYLRQHGMWDRILRDNRKAPIKDRRNFEGYIESRGIVRYVFEHKDEKKIYNLITDQSPYFDGPNQMEVEFMHQKCRSMRGAADLARKFGMAVCYLRMYSRERGHYIMEYVPICSDARLMDPEEIMKEYYRLLEEDINAQPWNYLWSHRRWK